MLDYSRFQRSEAGCVALLPALALERLRAASEDRAEGKRADQRQREYLDHLPACASRKFVAAHPIDMRTVARRTARERTAVVLRGRERAD
jgi:hypothetical protein